MCILKVSIAFICIANVIICSNGRRSHHHGQQSHDWDLLIFTQHLPASVCIEWKQKVPQHTCLFPAQKNLWTIHGIWPTKLGTIGPGFCNNSLHFNMTALLPLEQELNEYWTNIENGTKAYDLWKHEWTKHGSCAAVLPSLNTEWKYFSQGLEWIKKYEMASILSQANIVPREAGYGLQEVWDAILNATGKHPTIQCIHDSKTGGAYISEIRICFDKSLRLVDCDGVKGFTDPTTGIKTNCPLHKNILYPDDNQYRYLVSLLSNTDSSEENVEKKSPEFIPYYPRRQLNPMLKTLKLIELVSWLTL